MHPASWNGLRKRLQSKSTLQPGEMIFKNRGGNSWWYSAGFGYGRPAKQRHRFKILRPGVRKPYWVILSRLIFFRRISPVRRIFGMEVTLSKGHSDEIKNLYYLSFCTRFRILSKYAHESLGLL